MDYIDQAKRAPDLRALGLALVAGIVIAKGAEAKPWKAAAVVAVGIGCYYLGTVWEG